VLHDAWPMVERLAGVEVRAKLRVEATPAAVGLDATSLEQILLNLVSNARDAMPDGGPLDVALTATAAHVRLSVADGGGGIEPATLARMFEPLFTTKPRGQGTGLGLATTRMLVEQAGGTIDVDTQLGVGSTFHITLPLHAPQPRAEAPVGLRWAASAPCLLICDDTELLRSCSRSLASVGFEVITAATGSAMAEAIATHGPALRVIVRDATRFDSDPMSSAAHAPNAREVVLVNSPTPDALSLVKPFTQEALANRAFEALAQSDP
jgi:two-component system cell cycle sensor histidine kinase/response regulator CckA